ncbi:hypothetical protein KA050_03795 [Candidatus Gracilibacteria bacterium]|nr:hypothetical protein [Candidatus Gracilibacteria bacterium]
MFQPFNENIVEKKKCRITGEEFFVTEKDKALYEKLGVPAPTLSPTELYRNIFAYRQEWNLFQRKCSKTGVPLLSCYRENTVFPVYENKLWWSDDWSALDYGRAFDFSRPFFEQYKSLQDVVPREGTTIFNSENCTYNGHCRSSKNCYLSTLISKAENVYYSYWTNEGRNIFASSMTNSCENIYDCLDTIRCNSCVSCQESRDCQECYFSYQLKNCQNCIACSGLVGKQYYIYNKPSTAEEFKKTLALLQSDLTVWMKAKSVFEKIRSESVRPESQFVNCENCAGDHLQNSRDCFESYDGLNGENLRYVLNFMDGKDCAWAYSLGWPFSELCSHGSVIRGSTNVHYSYYAYTCKDIWYSDSCLNSSDLFGCLGVNHGQYAIMNTVYSQQEYSTLRTKIIDHMKSTGEWGEFFPIALSPYPYNDTAAMDYYPLTESEALARKYVWGPSVKSANVPNTSNPPLHISQYDEKKVGHEIAQKNIDTLLTSVFRCSETSEPFQIIRQELAFHIENSIPLPTTNVRTRHRELMKLRNPRELHERACGECDKKIATSYTPERPEKILCEACYMKHIY